MSELAFLVLNQSGDPNEERRSESIAAAANYFYPVLWWSIFSFDDIVSRTEHDWEDEQGNPVAVTFPSLFTSLTLAKRRASARQRLFFSYFPITLQPIYQQWLTLLEGIDAPYLQMNTGNVWSMSEPERSNREIQTYARAFDGGGIEEWVALLYQADILLDPITKELSYEEADIGYLLRGERWYDRAVPWADD
jgi:hypothetical protein